MSDPSNWTPIAPTGPSDDHLHKMLGSAGGVHAPSSDTFTSLNISRSSEYPQLTVAGQGSDYSAVANGTIDYSRNGHLKNIDALISTQNRFSQLVSIKADDETINVPGHHRPSPTPDPPPAPSGGDFTGGGGNGGAKSSGNTSSGTYWSTRINLTDQQKDALVKILNKGISLNLPNQYLFVAADLAFSESSFDNTAKNPSSSASGLYQYTNGTWNTYHSNLNKSNEDDQITALYEDLQKWHNMFDGANIKKSDGSSMTFAEFAEIKHHYGDSAGENTIPYSGYNVKDFDKQANNLGLGLSPR